MKTATTKLFACFLAIIMLISLCGCKDEGSVNLGISFGEVQSGGKTPAGENNPTPAPDTSVDSSSVAADSSSVTQTPSTSNKKVDFSSLDKLIASVPAYSFRVLKAYSNEAIEEAVKKAEALDRSSATQSQVNAAHKELKSAIDHADFLYDDIDAIHIDYNREPVKNGGYVKARIIVATVTTGLTNQIEDDNAEIRIRGNTTAGLAKKPYNIKFSKPTNLFGMGAGRVYCLLANAMDASLIRNTVAMELGKRLKVPYTSAYRHVDVYINGQYKGNYLLLEHIEAGKDRVDIQTAKGEFLLEYSAEGRTAEGSTYVKSDGYEMRFEFNEPETPTAAQIANAKKILNKIDDAIATKDINKISAVIDVESFIRFGILNEYMKMADFNWASPRYHYKNGKLYAGPGWDFDLSSGNANATTYEKYCSYGTSFDGYKGKWILDGKWYKALFECPDFKAKWISTYKAVQPTLVNFYQNNAQGKCFIDELYTKYYNSFERNYTTAGWKIKNGHFHSTPETTLEGNIDYLKRWLKARNEWLLENVK